MKFEKCSKCGQKYSESTISYCRRTKDIFHPLPCFCQECTRIIKAFNPTEKDIHKQIKAAKIKQQKKLIKENIKQINKDHHVIIQKKEADEKRRKNFRHFGSKTRSKRRNSLIDLQSEEKNQIRKFYNDCPPGYHVDHIIPISRGGKHCLANLQYLEAGANIRKGNKIELEILEQFLDTGNFSIAFLQRKFKLSFLEAKNIFKDLQIYVT